MKLPLCLAFAIALAGAPVFGDSNTATAGTAPAPAGESKPEFHGMIVTKSERQFNISSAGGAKSAWVTVGDNFAGWRVDAFDEKTRELILNKTDGATLRLTLVDGKVGAASGMATLPDAQRMLEKIQFGKMLKKILDGQKEAQIRAMRRMLEQKHTDPGKIDKLVDQQTKLLDRMWGSLNMTDIQNSMAQIYSEEFTADQLSGISEFYDTAAGQAALEKAPEIQQKLMATIMPQLIAVQQQMQAEQRAAAAKPAAAPAAAPTP